VTSETVAKSLENAYGNSTFVDCDPSSGDWACTIYDLAQPRSSCLIKPTQALSSPREVHSGPIPAIYVVTTCAVKTTTSAQVIENETNLVAVAGSGERAAAVPIVLIKPKKNVFLRAWDYFVLGR
jgi:hypothetical protein